MKDPIERTKVVLRHLPPSHSQSSLMEQIDARFAGRYKWASFRPGKNSQKHQKYGRAYIDFKRSEDVIEFAEFFDGHVFVNEKGSQFKIVVEYAPSQRVPKLWSKKDVREGTIFKDPEYLDFLEHLAKPVENLPSAEVQLEKRESERAGATKEAPIVTPLMDFVRQKRAAKSVSQRSSSSGKPSKRNVGSSTSSVKSASTKRGSEKRRASSSMYILSDRAKNASGKEKSSYVLVQRREARQLSDNSISPTTTTSTKAVEEKNFQNIGGAVSRAAAGAVDIGKKKVLLLKGKEREIVNMTEDVPQQHNVASPVGHSAASTGLKQNQRRDSGGKMIKSILLSKETRQSQSSVTAQSEQQIHTFYLGKEKRPPRSARMRSTLEDQDSGVSRATCSSDNDLKRIIENKEGSYAIDEPLFSSSSMATRTLSDSLEGVEINQQVPANTEVSKHGNNHSESSEFITKSSYPSGKSRNLYTVVRNSRLGRGSTSSVYDLPSSHGDVKVDMYNSNRSGEIKTVGSGRSSLFSVENGSHRHVGRRGQAHSLKEIDGLLYTTETKPSKRGGSTGHGSHEKQVWVQKSGSGS